jgi:hypothetical protein
MKTAPLLISLSLLAFNSAWGAEPPRDLKIELPRDARILVFGVPSVAGARAAGEGLRQALADYAAEKGKGEETKAKIFFRLGRFDHTLSSLADKLREQQRIKGLEGYEDLARELDIESESLAMLAGVSAVPVIVEDGEAGDAAQAADADANLAIQLRTQLARIDATLDKIEDEVKPDEERKVELEARVSELGQFVLHIKSFFEQVKGARDGELAEVTFDGREIAQGVQNLIDALREIREERSLQGDPPRQRERREPRPHHRHRELPE